MPKNTLVPSIPDSVNDNPEIKKKDAVIKKQMTKVHNQAKKIQFLSTYISGIAGNKGDTTPWLNELAKTKREIKELKLTAKDLKLAN